METEVGIGIELDWMGKEEELNDCGWIASGRESDEERSATPFKSKGMEIQREIEAEQEIESQAIESGQEFEKNGIETAKAIETGKACGSKEKVGNKIAWPQATSLMSLLNW